MVSLLLIGLWRCSNEENMGSENTSNKNITFKGNLTGESTGKDSKLTQVGFGQLPKINDPDYLSINRFEGPIGNSIKRVAKKKETLSPLGTRLPTQRKKFVFSGEGFEIGDFERHYDQNLVIDYHYHINFDNHRIVPREPVPH